MGSSLAPLRRIALQGRHGGLALLLAVFVVLLTTGISQAQCAASVVDLRTPSGSKARFTVELAEDDRTRAQGLMHRPSLGRSAGMLFIYPRPVQASFWMKNTLIPLDMLFIDETGKVTRVHHDAVPLDETPIDGGRDVRFVLEINAGLARRLGLVEGSDLRHPAVPQDIAAWPCD
jgi:uncharacterized protein